MTHSAAVLTTAGTNPDKALAVPNDPALPGCALLHQAELRTEVMSRLLSNWLGPKEQLLESSAVPWRYVPGKRCNFQLELVIAPASGAAVERRCVIGKLYAKDHGEKVHRMLQDFRSRGFSSGRFRVPEPLAYDARWRLLLLSWTEGNLLRSLLLGGADASEQVEEAAGWLLKLHQCGVKTGPRLTFRRHFQTLAEQRQRLAEVYPASEGLLEDLLRRIEERGIALSGWTPRPVHRDFSHDHLIFDGEHVTALDFDEFCQYDPMFDVAHFMAHLRLLSLRNFGVMDRFDGLGERFRAAYQAGARGYFPARLCLCQAIAHFKLAYILAVVVQPSGWQQEVDSFLREARQVL